MHALHLEPDVVSLATPMIGRQSLGAHLIPMAAIFHCGMKVLMENNHSLASSHLEVGPLLMQSNIVKTLLIAILAHTLTGLQLSNFRKFDAR